MILLHCLNKFYQAQPACRVTGHPVLTKEPRYKEQKRRHLKTDYVNQETRASRWRIYARWPRTFR